LAPSEDLLHSKAKTAAPTPRIPRQHLSPALQIACQRGFRKIVVILLDSGADPFYRSDKGKTALDIALSNRHINISIDLLNRGGPFNPASPAVARLIDDAVEVYQLELATSLVQSGANPTSQYQRATQNTHVLQEERERLINNMDILDKAMKSLLSRVRKGSGLGNSTLCSACLQFLRRPPRFYETCLKHDRINPIGCDLCALARDSFGTDIDYDSSWSVQFLASNDENGTRFKIRLSTNTDHGAEHEIRQLSGIDFRTY